VNLVITEDVFFCGKAERILRHWMGSMCYGAILS
jgi:hypothetical protein